MGPYASFEKILAELECARELEEEKLADRQAGEEDADSEDEVG